MDPIRINPGQVFKKIISVRGCIIKEKKIKESRICMYDCNSNKIREFDAYFKLS